MASKIRPARMAADDVEEGDVIVHPRSDGGGVIGTVVRREGSSWDGFRFVVQTPNGSHTSWPPHRRQAIAGNRPVWVNVPAGSA